ncbi:MAG: hypothetical protein KME06_09505 [Kastovskya adunca ATA6-11-RM4]|jgi:phage FluMu gp28-like protein|nr:hypothetical protein [Kastovskya adunca ATA6-11-RM4]
MRISELGLAPEEVPKILLPYQQRWLADTSGIKLYTKSRRIGISWTEASDCALAAAQTNGENTYYIGYEKEMSRGFVEDAADWAKAYNIAVSQIDEDEEIFRDGDEDKSILVFRIHFNSGYKIEALSSSPRNLRSRQGRVVIDEASFHDDFPGLFKAGKALRLWGSHIHIITTYNGIEEPYYELEQDVIKGKFPYSRHFTDFNRALEEGLYGRICLVMGKKWSAEAEAEWKEQTIEEFGDDADEELFCIPSRSGGVYFPRVLVEQCMSAETPVLRLSLPDEFALKSEEERFSEMQDWLEFHLAPLLDTLHPHLRSSYGMDFGRSGDLSYIIPLQEQPNLVRKAPFGLELRNVPFKQQEQILFYLADRLPRFVGGSHDARGNGQYLAEVAMQRYGISRISQIMLTNNWYLENMPKYKSALEDRSILLPEDSDLLLDHRCVVVERGVPKVPDSKRKRGTDGKQRHGDGAIAAALAWHASNNDQEEGYKSQGSTSFDAW